MDYEVRLVLRPKSAADVDTVLEELDKIGEVTTADVTVDVRLVVDAPTTEDASHQALRLVERAVTYADEVWQAETREARTGSGGEGG